MARVAGVKGSILDRSAAVKPSQKASQQEAGEAVRRTRKSKRTGTRMREDHEGDEEQARRSHDALVRGESIAVKVNGSVELDRGVFGSLLSDE